MTFTKISVLIPTRGRVERLRTLLDSYEQTAVGSERHSELVFRVDEDDRETQQLLAQHRDYVRKVLVGPRKQGYRSLSSFVNEMAMVANGDVLMIGNDDMAFKTPGWAPAILEAANRYPDGLFDVGVKTFNEDHYPFVTVSRHAADCVGFLWDPRIFWIDIFWRDVMGTMGRNVMLPSVHIEHEWIGNAPDRTFLESNRDLQDPNYWQVTHAGCVVEAVEKLRALPAATSHVDESIGQEGTVSFIVPTVGRPSLKRTLQSIETRPGDEIIVVADESVSVDLAAYGVRRLNCSPGNDWGHTERNFAMPHARCRYMAHIDDDDYYVPGHRALMDEVMREHSGRPMLFRMQYPHGGTLWQTKTLACGNLGTPMFIVPNVPSRFGKWTPHVGGDFVFLESCGWKADEFVWREEVIVQLGH